MPASPTSTKSGASPHRRSEGVGRQGQCEIGSRIEICAHVRGEIGGDSANLELPCARHVGSRRHGGVVGDRGERPSPLQRRRREAPQETRKAKGHPPFRRTPPLRKKD